MASVDLVWRLTRV